MDIRISDITIQDTNQNELYDAGVDGVLDATGNPLSPREQKDKLQKILKDLGTVSWRGVWLPAAAELVEQIHLAQSHAEAGEVEATREALQKARAVRGNLPLASDRLRTGRILKQALLKGIEVNFKEALTIAQKGGDVQEVRDLLDVAHQYGTELKEEFFLPKKFDEKKAFDILTQGYRNMIAGMVQEADHQASLGNISYTEEIFYFVHANILQAKQVVGLNLTYDWQRAERTIVSAYPKGIEKEFQYAVELAFQGRAADVREVLNNLRKTVSIGNRQYHLGLSFDQARADKIMEQARIIKAHRDAQAR